MPQASENKNKLLKREDQVTVTAIQNQKHHCSVSLAKYNERIMRI